MFEPARPDIGGGGKSLTGFLHAGFVSPFARLFDNLRLLRHEGISSYLLFLLSLVLASGLALVAVSASGFGELFSTHATAAGRALTIVVSCLAMASAVLFGANITSALTARKIKEARGLDHAVKQTKHLLVLGWKERMTDLLEALLAGSDIGAENVVVVADIDAERAEDLMADPDLVGIRVVRGPHYAEKTLKLAAPDKASAVLLLADESKPGSNDFEIDSRTVMAALVLAKHVRNAHVVAELLDASHEAFLRNSRIVDEIIYPREYGGQLLRLAMDGIGLVNTFNSLVQGQGEGQFATRRIPDLLIGRTFAELRAEIVRERPGALVIGLVEHTGKHAERKAEALREAQRTPDVKRLVENLRAVKTLVANQPRLNPPDDHVIQPNTLAIVIERKEG